jgi:4-hydroxy-2-oxoheptanedioate aldolase
MKRIMRSNHTLARLRAGQPALGMWLQLGSVNAARMLAAQGLYDWLLVDLEHSPVEIETAARMLTAIADVSGGRVTPLCRVIAGTMHHIKQALDAGAQGVLVPMVSTAQEARDVVRFSRFPPEGERGGGGLAPHLSYATNRAEYSAQANREVLVGIQIETREAIDNLDSILDVPGLDLIFIGPNDLHMSYGLPPRYWSDEPAFLNAVERVRAGCQARGLPLGILTGDGAAGKARRADGFTFIGLGTDANTLLRGAGLHFGAMTDTPEPAGGWAAWLHTP